MTINYWFFSTHENTLKGINTWNIGKHEAQENILVAVACVLSVTSKHKSVSLKKLVNVGSKN